MITDLTEAFLFALGDASGAERLFHESGEVSAGRTVEIDIQVTESGLTDAIVIFQLSNTAAVVDVQLEEPDGRYNDTTLIPSSCTSR